MARSSTLRIRRRKHGKVRFNRTAFETFIFVFFILLLVILNLYWLSRYSPRSSSHPRPKLIGISNLKQQQQQKQGMNVTATTRIIPQHEKPQTIHSANNVPKISKIQEVLLTRRQRLRLAKNRRPEPRFKHQRSKYKPPSDYHYQDEEIVPINYWTDHRPTRSLNFTRSVPYLGILIDAGRHYFEMDFLFEIINILHQLQFNWIHFRLTDDQTFNVKLESWPQLAIPTPYRNKDQKVYTPQQLRELVSYAKDRNITMIPEINVPGHAGAWAGIPGLVVPCGNFICQQGYGVPLNITHHLLPKILKEVLTEIVDIFDRPPFLHLGGDEIEMSKPCYKEINQPFPNYTNFERMLSQTLREISYNESQVIRWEMTLGGSDPKGKDRAGSILQWWFQIPGEKRPVRTKPNDPFIASSGLYFDFNEDDSAWEVFLHTRKFMFLNYNYTSMALVVGTFELDQEFWYHRNVLGKLVAVAMGASKQVQVNNGNDLFREYRHYCDSIGFPNSTCSKYGKPFLSWKKWKVPKWEQVMWKQLKDGLCDRLTMPSDINNTTIFRPELLLSNNN